MDDNKEEIYARLQATVNRTAEVVSVIKRMQSAVVGHAKSKPMQQRNLMRTVRQEITKLEASDLPSGLKTPLQIMGNEAQSLLEGLRANLVSASDMTLTTHVDVLKAAADITAKAKTKLESNGAVDHSLEWEQTINQNSKFKNSLPKITNGFGFARVPVAMSFVPNAKNKHSQVGYLNLEILNSAGFKAKMVSGYAIIYNQLVIGIDPRNTKTKEKVFSPKLNRDTEVFVPKKVLDHKVVFKGDDGNVKNVKRDMKPHDSALEYTKLLEKKTGEQWEFVSEKGYGHQGVTYFWLMTARDLNRFSKAFPGKHVGMKEWGFAF